MANNYFRFKEFTVHQQQSAMKVTTDACLFGAWCAASLATMLSVKRVLDIGGGTGLLSLIIAQKTSAIIDTVEIEPFAAKEAEENVQASPFAQRVTIIKGDILQLPFARYDAIVCNPPFYQNDLSSPDRKRNTAHHAAELTWNVLFPQIRKSLSDDGTFFLLLPYKRMDEAEHLLEKESLFIKTVVQVRPSSSHNYFRNMLCGSLVKPKKRQVEDLSIRDDKGSYTEEFTQLLKDYYLYL